jgi:hypothetical protein
MNTCCISLAIVALMVRVNSLEELTIDFSTCGITKHCFRLGNCSAEECLFGVSLVINDVTKPNVLIEMTGIVNDPQQPKTGGGYLALGVSDDKYMGHDIVFACYSTPNGTANVVLGHNPAHSRNEYDTEFQDEFQKNADAIIVFDELTARLSCRFNLNVMLAEKVARKYGLRLEEKQQFLLFARGDYVRLDGLGLGMHFDSGNSIIQLTHGHGGRFLDLMAKREKRRKRQAPIGPVTPTPTSSATNGSSSSSAFIIQLIITVFCLFLVN